MEAERLDVTKGQNCWEAKKCGREPGGAAAGLKGVCPATEAKALQGQHGGRNGGRACWVVAGTYCGDEVQGTYAAKLINCIQCDFYQRVRKEEGLNFQLAASLLRCLEQAS